MGHTGGEAKGARNDNKEKRCRVRIRRHRAAERGVGGSPARGKRSSDEEHLIIATASNAAPVTASIASAKGAASTAPGNRNGGCHGAAHAGTYLRPFIGLAHSCHLAVIPRRTGKKRRAGAGPAGYFWMQVHSQLFASLASRYQCCPRGPIPRCPRHPRKSTKTYKREAMHAHTTASYSKGADPKAIEVTDVAESVNQAPGS